MDYLQMTAPCGLDCFNGSPCHAEADEKLKAMIAEKLQILLEDAACKGCRAAGGQIAAIKMTEPCQVFQCISEKDIQFCYDCTNFPCDNFHLYADKWPHSVRITQRCSICS
jgi:hypothetical protein